MKVIEQLLAAGLIMAVLAVMGFMGYIENLGM
jgi:hypothetical protein